MGTAEIITEKLTSRFAPTDLRVIDESNQHAGHAGHRPEGESHFRIFIISNAFNGKTRLERHRLINETLADELKNGIHALAIHAATPEEAP